MPPDETMASPSPRLQSALWSALGFCFVAFLVFAALQAGSDGHFDTNAFLAAFAIGLFAQMVDGSLGMGYGVSSNTLLLAYGLSPAAATTTVHVAKIFTGAASGLSHWRLGNIDRRLFLGVAPAGMLGGLLGAVLVSAVDGRLLRPFVAAYLVVTGILILVKVFRPIRVTPAAGRRLAPIALFGGFADSVGGGGWGPVVTTSLIGAGERPNTTIGSVNAAEFFVTLASGFSFVVLIGVQHWESVAGLVLGGVVMAPFAAMMTKRFPTRLLMALVGLLITGLSTWTLWRGLT